MRTYVAVDGGMSDNLRPMLYGARYEAAIADRAEAPSTHVGTVAGMHCESGDILIKDVALRGAANRRRAGDPGHRRVRLRDGEQLQRRAAAAGDLLQGRRGARRRAPRDLRGPAARDVDELEPFRVGLLGHGTVGSAFDAAALRARRRDRGGDRPAARAVRRADALAGILRRDPRGGRRDRRADRRHRAGARVRAARARAGQAGRDREQAAAQPARRRAVRGGARGPARSFATRRRSPESCR